ncbi:biotin transporter BioY [[Clostridium] leptum]|nr:biotin transporter BioY [[Clostridium] leptum]
MAEKVEAGQPVELRKKHGLHIVDIALIGLFVALMTVGGKIRINLGPIPFTTQFFFSSVGGMVLGAKRGVVVQLVYLAMGLVGLPVFADGGGFGYIFHLTFGYIVGFVASALVCGLVSDRLFSRKGNMRFWQAFLAALSGLLLLYLVGTVYFLAVKNFYLGEASGVGNALIACVVPFMWTDILWCICVALAAPRIRKAVGRML